MVLSIDFETHYTKDYSVSEMGAWAYCRDPRFDAHLVAVSAEDGYEWVGHPSLAPWEKFASYETWVSHNANFDQEVYRAIVHLRGTLPAPREWHCTADLMAFLQYPRALKEAVHQAFGVDLDKSVRDRMRDPHDLFAPTSDEVNAYALDDARYCLKLWTTYSCRWPDNERKLSAHTRLMGSRGIGFDRQQAEIAVESLGRQLAEVEGSIPWVARGLPPTSRTELFNECGRLGLPCPTTTAEKNPLWQEWLEANEKDAPWVRGLNRWRKINRTREVVAAMLDRSTDTRLFYSLKYYGAAITGRWSGGDGLNLQNLNSKDTEGGIDLRGLLVPAEGKRFIVSDLSQIEPRVLAVLCGDEDMLAGLRRGLALYEAHARATMGWDGGPLKKENPALYALAKARVLGLSYGAAGETFVRVAKVMADLDISYELSERIVGEFRESNPKIVSMWDRMHRAFSEREGKGVCCFKTKSGRTLRYFNPAGGQASQAKGKSPKRFWGSKLVENLVQGTARDVLADMILRIEAAGIPVVLTVHDEVVCEVPVAETDAAMERVKRIMSTAPDWMPELPVACELKAEERYGK
jgi:DNA polymerase